MNEPQTPQWIPEIGHQVRSFDEIFTVRARSKDKETGRIYLYDQPQDEGVKGMMYALEDCEPMDKSDRPLDDNEIQTLKNMATVIIEDQCVYSLARFEDLTLDQKRQLWAVLTPEQRQGLKELKEQPTQPKPIAPPTASLAPSEGLRTIIAGSRTITDYSLVETAIIDSGFKISTVISGKEPNGVDRLGEIWAEKNGVPVEGYAADWSLGKKGGPIRNRKMAKEGKAQALILIWTGDRKTSPGGFDMLAVAIELGLEIYQVNLSQQVEVVA